ncbi:hypothetical protein D3C85_1031660 [compost metagenome]
MLHFADLIAIIWRSRKKRRPAGNHCSAQWFFESAITNRNRKTWRWFNIFPVHLDAVQNCIRLLIREIQVAVLAKIKSGRIRQRPGFKRFRIDYRQLIIEQYIKQSILRPAHRVMSPLAEIETRVYFLALYHLIRHRIDGKNIFIGSSPQKSIWSRRKIANVNRLAKPWHPKWKLGNFMLASRIPDENFCFFGRWLGTQTASYRGRAKNFAVDIGRAKHALILHHIAVNIHRTCCGIIHGQ